MKRSIARNVRAAPDSVQFEHRGGAVWHPAACSGEAEADELITAVGNLLAAECPL